MENNRQERILAEALKKAHSIFTAKKVSSNILPEEEKLFNRVTPSPGLHNHDHNNPFGLHRHLLGDPVDAPHVHTVQNPGGEHAHGENKGMALITGEHSHDNDGLGWHNHPAEETLDDIPIEEPEQILPPNPTDVKEE